MIYTAHHHLARAGFQEGPRAALRQDEAALREALRRLDGLAHVLDSAVAIPGTSIRIGADAALNLMPGVGVVIAKGLSSYLVYEARRLGAPPSLLMRMAGNIGVDFVISAIPLAGWVGDVFFRANRRNMDLLRRHIEARLRRSA